MPPKRLTPAEQRATLDAFLPPTETDAERYARELDAVPDAEWNPQQRARDVIERAHAGDVDAMRELLHFVLDDDESP